MKAAIYSRKSKESDKGDSIENQINMCISQLQFYGISDYEVFQDYGISGKDTNRPAFQEMMSKIKNNEFTHLVCYKLDRVTRSVADFSILVEKLNKYEVSFISVKEQFDTGSPMGRAMMYMLSVFAQFERETISERVSDNMIEMAKNGRFLAGIAPIGYSRKKIETSDGKTYTTLVINEEDKHIPILLYDKLFELGSKSAVRRWLADNNYRTKRGALYGDNSITTILNNLTYLEATTSSANYLENLGYKVYNKELLNKGYGYLHYNKRKYASNKDYDIDKQVVAVSTHPYIITLEQYQKGKQIVRNNSKFINNGKQINSALLSGILKCSKCGQSYLTAYGRDKRYYRCWTKQKYSTKYCDSKTFEATELEENIISTLKNIFATKDNLMRELEKNNKNNKSTKNNLERDIEKTKLEMRNITNAIAKTGDSDILVEEYKAKEKYLENLEIQKNKAEVDDLNYLLKKESASNFTKLIDTLDIRKKRMLLQDVVSSMHYDYEQENIVIELFNNDSVIGKEHSLPLSTWARIHACYE